MHGKEMIAVIGVLVMGLVLIMSALIPGILRSEGNVSFTGEKVWETNFKNFTEEISSGNVWMDLNGDNLAEISVELENKTLHKYSLAILNGSDGKIMHMANFTDVGFVAEGDNVGVEPTVYAQTYMNTNHTPYKMDVYMIFGNHTDNKHLSIYKLNSSTLQNMVYGYVEVPDSFTYFGQSVTVSSWQQEIYLITTFNDETLLVYKGIYIGTFYTYQVAEVDVKVFDSNLNVLWSKTDETFLYGGLLGVDYFVESFNGYGVNGHGANIAKVNISGANTTNITILNATNGQQIWNVSLPGIMPFVGMGINWPYGGTIDYNVDHKMDLVVYTLLSENVSMITVIDSSGVIKAQKKVYGMPTSPMGTYVQSPWPGLKYLFVQTMDVTGDGNGEFFYVENNTNLTALDIQHNTTLWKVNIYKPNYFYVPMLSTNDINGDGKYDVYLIGYDKNETSEGYKNITLSAVNSVDGSILWNRTFNYIKEFTSGTMLETNVSDINGDGFEDGVVAGKMGVDSQGTYVNITAIDLKTGGELWNVKVYADIYNTNFSAWYPYGMVSGDINGDGINDVYVELPYKDENNMNWTYMRFLSGDNGAIIWQGKVENATYTPDLLPLPPMSEHTGWNQFDYNGDNIQNELLITCGYSEYIYAVTGSVPEFNIFGFLLLLPALAMPVIARRK